MDTQSKNALLAWLQQVTKRSIKSLQELSNGVHFCLLLNLMTHGKFGLHKVNFNAKLEYERMNNLKQLIYGMQKNNINQNVEITKIASKNLHEMLQTLQWFRREIDKHNKGQNEKHPEPKKLTFTVKILNNTKIEPPILKKDPSQFNPVTLDQVRNLKRINLPEIPIRNEEKDKQMLQKEQEIPKLPLQQVLTAQHQPCQIHHQHQPQQQTQPQQPIYYQRQFPVVNNQPEQQTDDSNEEFKSQKNLTEKIFALKNPYSEKKPKNKEDYVSQLNAKRNLNLKSIHSIKEDEKSEKTRRDKSKDCLKSPSHVQKIRGVQETCEQFLLGLSPKTDHSSFTYLLSNNSKKMY